MMPRAIPSWRERKLQRKSCLRSLDEGRRTLYEPPYELEAPPGAPFIDQCGGPRLSKSFRKFRINGTQQQPQRRSCWVRARSAALEIGE